jgi:hypothetical protein
MINTAWSKRLGMAARSSTATFDDLWRAAAQDFLEACFTRQHHQIISELAAIFDRINARYQPL